MTTLTLNIPEEARKLIPWLIAAKKAGNTRTADSLGYQIKLARARERYRLESEARRQEDERWRREEREALRREREHEREREERERLEQGRLFRQRFPNVHEYWTEEGLEFLPAHSSNKGFRRMISEYPEGREDNDYAAWGNEGVSRSNEGSMKRPSHNCARKPRRFRDFR